MGALPFLRLCRGQVDDVQLVEPPGFDPDIAVLAGGSHRHQVQGHRCCQAVAVLVVCVVAPQFRSPRGRIQMHLTPRAKIQLKLCQGRTIPNPLPG